MIKVGIIGTGFIARQHASAIAAALGEGALVAASDTSSSRLEEFASAFHVARRFEDPEGLIADADLDLVVIATPPATHERLAVAALDQGKYVLCEKPLAHSLASAARIAEAEARHPGRLAVSHQLRYDPSFRRLLWLSQHGWIGELGSAQLERHADITHSDHGRGGWWGAWNVAGGGVLLTQLVHELDLLLLAMGPASSVQAMMDTRYTGIESEDHVEATVRFASGATARLVATVNSGRAGGGFAIQGSRGLVGLPSAFATEDARGVAAAVKALDAALPDTRPSSPSLVARGWTKLSSRLGGGTAPELSPHAKLYRDIERCMAKGDPLPVPPAEAIQSLELCMAIYESAIVGREVSLPLGPENEVYAGVTTKLYSRRKVDALTSEAISCNHDLIGLAASHAVRPAAHPLERAALGLARRGLAQAGLRPAHLKALLARPPQVHGGPRARRWPWPARRMFDHRERRAVLRLMDRELREGGAIVYGGVEEQAYCEAFSRYLGGGHADAVNSGTNALYVALRALNLEPGSEVIVPPATDAGGTMPIALLNCIPVPADAAPGSVLTSADEIRRVITDRTSAIVVAHIAGHPVDMDPVLELAREHGLPIVEDCAQAHGAIYKGQMVGTLGTIAAFSTMFGKHHATGAQGGVVFSRDPQLIVRARQMADRGKPYGVRGSPGNLYASLNMNQDEISMAIGRVQLEKLPGFVEARRRFAALVAAGLQAVDGVRLVGDPAYGASSYLFLMLRFDEDKLGCTCQQFAVGLSEEGIEDVYAGYTAYPTDQPWYRQAAVFGSSGMPWSLRSNEVPAPFELPNVRRANRSIVRVDIHESMGPREAKDLVTAIGKIATHYKAIA